MESKTSAGRSHRLAGGRDPGLLIREVGQQQLVRARRDDGDYLMVRTGYFTYMVAPGEQSTWRAVAMGFLPCPIRHPPPPSLPSRHEMDVHASLPPSYMWPWAVHPSLAGVEGEAGRRVRHPIGRRPALSASNRGRGREADYREDSLPWCMARLYVADSPEPHPRGANGCDHASTLSSEDHSAPYGGWRSELIVHGQMRGMRRLPPPWFPEPSGPRLPRAMGSPSADPFPSVDATAVQAQRVGLSPRAPGASSNAGCGCAGGRGHRK